MACTIVIILSVLIWLYNYNGFSDIAPPAIEKLSSGLFQEATMSELYELVCKVKGLEPNEVTCIWDYFNLRKQSLLRNTNHQTLEDANIIMDHDILLDVSVDTNRSSHSGVHSMGNELALVPLEPQRSSVSIAGGPALSNAIM
ncbi:hypothetical protein TSUD_128910 [Trifolium subterraneum]|uniref:Uncharacterized protein n=1 Tax=Trifolium subterraneum TaxID=3900 RepID=A0A2Z6NZ25_TRISU|nr:hypothetical protein TSUD_128910 [Trifolium subterraneum]